MCVYIYIYFIYLFFHIVVHSHVDLCATIRRGSSILANSHQHLPRPRKEKTHWTTAAVCSLLLRGTSTGAKSIFIFLWKKTDEPTCRRWVQEAQQGKGSPKSALLTHPPSPPIDFWLILTQYMVWFLSIYISLSWPLTQNGIWCMNAKQPDSKPKIYGTKWMSRSFFIQIFSQLTLLLQNVALYECNCSWLSNSTRVSQWHTAIKVIWRGFTHFLSHCTVLHGMS